MVSSKSTFFFPMVLSFFTLLTYPELRLLKISPLAHPPTIARKVFHYIYLEEIHRIPTLPLAFSIDFPRKGQSQKKIFFCPSQFFFAFVSLSGVHIPDHRSVTGLELSLAPFQTICMSWKSNRLIHIHRQIWSKSSLWYHRNRPFFSLWSCPFSPSSP